MVAIDTWAREIRTATIYATSKERFDSQLSDWLLANGDAMVKSIQFLFTAAHEFAALIVFTPKHEDRVDFGARGPMAVV